MNINASDLADFLRSRKSADCKMAADWAEDNPDHPVTLREVARLWDWILAADREMQEDDAAYLNAALRSGLLDRKCSWGPAASVVLPLRFWANYFGLSSASWWWNRMETASHRAISEARTAAWAATLVRGIKAAVFPVGD